MKERSKVKITALTAVMTAFVYAMTSISIPMPPPLGVWHIGDIASFTAAILCGPVVGAFACGVGAVLFDVWNPLWGSAFITWWPATIVIRSFMGFLLGKLRDMIKNRPIASEVIAMIVAAVEKNLGYFIYDYLLYGPIAYMDLVTFFPLSALDIIVTVPLLASIRKALKIRYVIE